MSLCSLPTAAFLLVLTCSVQALPLVDRRCFISEGATASFLIVSSPPACTYAADDIPSLLNAKTLYWNNAAWSLARYRASTLESNNRAPAATEPTFYPSRLEGYHSIRYKFDKASFPQGRKILSIRTAGAGLGTCLILPNVGYNPSAHAIHFIRGGKQDLVYEDLAYNIPRRFEAFWPEAKVMAVQTNGSNNAQSNNLGMKCLVTGDGCTSNVNPSLHLPASRVAIDFDAPTRRSGRMTQSTDVTMLESNTQSFEDEFFVERSYSQYNVNQDLQTFYKEVTSLKRLNDSVDGKTRVAAFLPKYIKNIDGNTEDGYDENEAVAMYDYKFELSSIDDSEAASL
jgi:hypothetical protein